VVAGLTDGGARLGHEYGAAAGVGRRPLLQRTRRWMGA
jgi:hypothetical protein